MNICEDKSKRRRVGGFTLIELLVVISIIAALMAVLMPSLQRVRKQARGMKCRANVKHWGVIFSLYASDNSQSFPQNFQGDGMSTYDSYWCHATMAYYENQDIRYCPSMKRNTVAIDNVAGGGTGMVYGGTFINWGPFAKENTATPETWWDEFPEGSYGMNEWCSNPPSGRTEIWDAPVKLTWRKTMNVRQANNTPLFHARAFC